MMKNKIGRRGRARADPERPDSDERKNLSLKDNDNEQKTKIMTIQEKIRKITEIAEDCGWSVHVDDSDRTDIEFEFERYTMHGQDFNFSVNMQKEDTDTLIANMKDYYNGFDPDYEAYLWIGDDGHGRCGAPYHIKDIVADMENVDKYIYRLLQTLEAELVQ